VCVCVCVCVLTGTPGGDFGEMLNAMSVYERLTRMKMTRQVVENTLRSYLAVGPAFFFATDEDALKRLSKKIGVSDLLCMQCV